MAEYAEKFEDYKEFLNTVVRYDFSLFEIPKDHVVLDVGCAFGDRIRALRKLEYSSVSGIEPDPYCVDKCEDPAIELGSITETGKDPDTYDAVLVENVFHHIPESDYELAVIELKRILKPGGSLCVVEPRHSFARTVLDLVTFHTPVPAIFKGPWKLRHEVMGEEIATGLYPLWLRRHPLFFSLLERHFEITLVRKKLFFFFAKVVKADK